MSRIAYKLIRIRRDGSLGSLFINKSDRLPIGKWLPAKHWPTARFAPRTGWHALYKPEAPHLSKKGRRWFAVQLKSYSVIPRPASQGGLWFVAKQMKILYPIK